MLDACWEAEWSSENQQSRTQSQSLQQQTNEDRVLRMTWMRCFMSAWFVVVHVAMLLSVLVSKLVSARFVVGSAMHFERACIERGIRAGIERETHALSKMWILLRRYAMCLNVWSEVFSTLNMLVLNQLSGEIIIFDKSLHCALCIAPLYLGPYI